MNERLSIGTMKMKLKIPSWMEAQIFRIILFWIQVEFFHTEGTTINALCLLSKQSKILFYWTFKTIASIWLKKNQPDHRFGLFLTAVFFWRLILMYLGWFKKMSCFIFADFFLCFTLEYPRLGNMKRFDWEKKTNEKIAICQWNGILIELFKI